MLHEHGFQKHGNERMYNGATGKMINTMIFIGPTYYQRLKHMVVDKVHSRTTGKVSTLERQPVEGRARDGGLRFGEMEKDCMVSHGASEFLKERLLHCSDDYQCNVCDTCGMICGDVDTCRSCNDDSNIFTVQLPYASKLFFQELISMGIAPRIHSTDNIPDLMHDWSKKIYCKKMNLDDEDDDDGLDEDCDEYSDDGDEEIEMEED